MHVLQAPNEWEHGVIAYNMTFLAGGITNCHNWQQDAINQLQQYDLPVLLFNPRRDDWNMEAGLEESRKQIEWEYKYLKECVACIFWFPPETLCPITLFELGYMLGTRTKLFIGCDPEYKRKFDVEVQTSLRDPKIKVHDNLKDLINEYVDWIRN